MSMNLGNSKETSWNQEHDWMAKGNPYGLMQIGTDDSYAIYGDGIHANVCKRLREYYERSTRRMIECEAREKGELHPWKCKDKAYYNGLLAKYLKELWYMQNLERLEQMDGSEVTWYVS